MQGKALPTTSPAGKHGTGLKLLLALCLSVLALPASAEIWRFGLIGDVPYSTAERVELPKMLAAITDTHVDFIAHVGDIKHGGDRCDDAVFEDRRAMFDASRAPFVFIPGDNEWSDCVRVSNGSYVAQERLDKLRSLFWPDEFSLGQKKIRLERQPGAYPEHSRWRLGPVLFVTLNLPGGNNNRGLTNEASPEFLARNPQVLAWLRENFALARSERLRGIVLLFQANPGFTHLASALTANGYRDFLVALRQETLDFPGQVVAVHGDTHISRVDKPLRDDHGKRIANFTRVETFGYPMMGWTRGIIDSEAPELFRFESNAWPPARR